MLVSSSEMMYFGIIVGSHQMNRIREQEVIFIPERDFKDDLILTLLGIGVKIEASCS